jgi:hypothetical protein
VRKVFVRKRNLASACVLFASIALLVMAAPASSARAATAADPTAGPTIIPSVHNDVSVALTAMGGEDENNDKEKKKEKKEKPHRQVPGRGDGNASDVTAAHSGTGALSAAAPALLNSFEGLGNGFSGPNGAFTVNSAPPDTNGAVGPNHYVETVNSSFAIFNKGGVAVSAAAARRTTTATRRRSMTASRIAGSSASSR